MKAFPFTVLSLYIHFTCLGQNTSFNYSIDGRMEGVASGKIYLSVFSPSGERDSAEIRKGIFRFEGALSEPSPVILSLERNFINKPQFMFFVDKGKHTIELSKGNLENGIVSGSKATEEYELLKRIEKPFDEKFTSIRHLASDTSKAGRAKWGKLRAVILEGERTAQAAFIKEHPSSPIAAWVLLRYFSNNPDDETIFKKLYEILSPSLYYTSYALSMREKLAKIEMLSIGNEAPDFTQEDTSGVPVSLSDFRGKYVLVDFWASWCGPCRAENPNVVKAFDKYKDKNFTILGVSLDQPGKKQAWLDAIHKDGLWWNHVSDLKFWDNAVAKQYGIRAIPQNLLIDPTGKIIAKNVRGDELSKKLQEILD